MKLIISFIVLVNFSHVQSVKVVMDEHYKNIVEVCRKNQPIDQVLLDRAVTGDFSEDRSLKCYIKCLYEQLNAIKEDGTFDIDKILDDMPDHLEHKYNHPLKKCGTIPGEDLCETAFKTVQCVYENNKEHFYIP